VENPGGTLAVTIEGKEGVISRLTLEGPTQIVRQYTV
jgi:hypothetical protein